MKVCVFGAGYVGLVTGACFAEMGNDDAAIGAYAECLRQYAGNVFVGQAVKAVTAQALFGPGVEVGDRVDDPSAKLAIDRAGAETAVLLERSSRQPEMHGGIGRPQETGYDGGGSGIHGRPPLGFDHSGGLPLVAGSNGATVTTPAADSSTVTLAKRAK